MIVKCFGLKLRPRFYGGKQVLNQYEGNELLSIKILEDKPFMAGRFGSSELKCVTDYFLEKNEFRTIRMKDYETAFSNNGIFPLSINALRSFGDEMIQAMSNCDVLCVWYNIMEDYFGKHFLPTDAKFTHRSVFDFWNYKIPWTNSLKGKKVLVVHPFSDTIQKQYLKRNLLFKNTNILPEFDLYTLKAVQTIAGQNDKRFSDWEMGLNYMFEEAMKIDFDVALIGCGSYGYPLSSKLKSAGRIAIHMGGVTQVLFGIKGKRWDNDRLVSELYNEYWVRPDASEKPQNSNNVENGCYW
jgi:hypothetical protein